MVRFFLPAFATLLVLALAGAGCTTQPAGSSCRDITPATLAAGIDRDLINIRESNGVLAGELSVTGLSGPGAEKVLADHYAAHTWANSAAAVSNASILVAIAPAGYRNLTGTDLSYQPETREIIRNRVPSISPLFPLAEGVNAVVQSYPVNASDGSYLGYGDLTYNPAVLIGRTVDSATNGTPLDVLVFQTDGVILYDTDPGAVGQNVRAYPPYQDPSFQSFLIRAAGEPSGSGTCRDGTGERFASWSTAGIDGAVWRVVVIRQAAAACT